MGKISSPGDIREQELYELLVSRFGKNCVYRSPKVYPHGEEKELADILVLALPYAIVFQSKWKQLTETDLRLDEAGVKRARLIRTMEEAASQFVELDASLAQGMSVRLPQVWAGDETSTYDLPLNLIKKFIPVVVVDFEDKDYDNPDKRYGDVPPVITDVPKRIEKWGLVHSFLFKDFSRILQMVFTIGDLILWLSERSRLFGREPKTFWGYNELTLFSLYLTNYPRWKAFLSYDAVWLQDNDFYERIVTERSRELSIRASLFSRPGMISVVENLMVQTIIDRAQRNDQKDAVLGYLEFWGRFLCCTAMEREGLSTKLRMCFEEMADCAKKGCLRTSSGIFDPRSPMGDTVFCVGVADYDDDTAEAYAAYAYARMLSNLRSQGLTKNLKQAFVALVRYDKPSVSCLLRTDLESDTECYFTEEELEKTRSMFSREDVKSSEWKMVREHLEQDER